MNASGSSFTPQPLLLLPPTAQSRRALGGVSSARLAQMATRLQQLGCAVVQCQHDMKTILAQHPGAVALSIAGEEDSLDTAVVPGSVVLQALRQSSLAPLELYFIAAGKRRLHSQRQRDVEAAARAEEDAAAGVASSSPLPKKVHLMPADFVRKTHPAWTAPEGSPARTYACFWPAPLDHPNEGLTNALELVEEMRAAMKASSKEHFKDLAHGPLAFRRASCAIKALKFKVTQLAELEDVPFVGGRSLAVLRDVLEGRGLQDYTKPELQVIVEFKQIFGVGNATAWQWYDLGYRDLPTVRQAVAEGQLSVTSQVEASLKYWDELRQGVSREETEVLATALFNTAKKCLRLKFGQEVAEGLRMEVVGGYRRGKPHCADVDVIFYHPTKGAEVEPVFLGLLLERLKAKGRLLWTQPHVYRHSAEKLGALARHASTSYAFDPDAGIMDLHDKDLTIMRLPGTGRAVRVDIIAPKAAQAAFCVLGWTGNKMYNRELRRYAAKELNLVLSSEALVDNNLPPRPSVVFEPTGSLWTIPCQTEEDILKELNVPIFPLEWRNH